MDGTIHWLSTYGKNLWLLSTPFLLHAWWTTYSQQKPQLFHPFPIVFIRSSNETSCYCNHCTLFVFSICGPKQNARSLLKPVSYTVFYALSHGNLHFVLHGSFTNRLFQRFCLVVENFWPIRSSGLKKLPWTAKPRLPVKEHKQLYQKQMSKVTSHFVRGHQTQGNKQCDGYSELWVIPAQLSFATLLTTQGRSNTIRMNSYILPATPDLVHQLFSVTFRWQMYGKRSHMLRFDSKGQRRTTRQNQMDIMNYRAPLRISVQKLFFHWGLFVSCLMITAQRQTCKVGWI